MLNVNIATNGAAFEDSEGVEAARILRGLADRLEVDWLAGRPVEGVRLFDVNGNRVGELNVS